MMNPSSIDMSTKHFNMFINGEIVPSGSEEYFESTNPSNGEVIATVANASIEDMEAEMSAGYRRSDHKDSSLDATYLRRKSFAWSGRDRYGLCSFSRDIHLGIRLPTKAGDSLVRNRTASPHNLFGTQDFAA